jgi:hypothetical protein
MRSAAPFAPGLATERLKDRTYWAEAGFNLTRKLSLWGGRRRGGGALGRIGARLAQVARSDMLSLRGLLLALLACGLWLGTAPSLRADYAKARIAALDPQYRQWLEDVELLIGKDERAQFLALEKDYQRDGFIHRFWEARNPVPGASAFFIDSAAELDGVYAAIEDELRSRYLLAYQPKAPPREGEFRAVEVRVAGAGLRVKTIRGYYP